MVSRGKAVKTAIAGVVGVAVVGVSVAAAWPSDLGLKAVPDHQHVVSKSTSKPTSAVWPASWSRSTAPNPVITQSSAPAVTAPVAPTNAPTPSPSVSKVAQPTGVLLSKPLNGPVTSPFGMRFHPILHVWKLHTGVDFGAPCGTPVGASAPGKVIFAGYVGGYGNRVEVDHGVIAGKHVTTTYSHLSVIGVRVGQQVDVHQAVALSGTTGYSTGCHLHYEVVVNGQFTDPLPWLNGKPAVVDLDKLKPIKGATVPAGELHHPDPVPPTPHPMGTATPSTSPSNPSSTPSRAPSRQPSAPRPSAASPTLGTSPSPSTSQPGATTSPKPTPRESKPTPREPNPSRTSSPPTATKIATASGSDSDH
ncbi:peptidoglycan DD-metalloendopeptidase family protein [Cutibacterium equinum]|uniref:Peptidoglycan DD-metalloendopeptidase family protein n=1 Tax=Cutibacterium equinum TaxID=3016342 RepID=A0ABY7QXI2_9ACTN|nr:peptidoglycan DD-metalloendopeptidase family protein [Cutibacterium equinum]WCC79747.1 peptidoglycan DD-metalloendopeptidase family protein [Cutibacterium equinum]